MLNNRETGRAFKRSKFGSSWPGENRDSEIVSIPGLRGREPKEISLKTLSEIINASCRNN